MIRARKREGSDEEEERIRAQRPEDGCVEDTQVLSRKHVVGSQVTRGTPEGRGREAIEKVCRVEGRVAYVQCVGVPLQGRLFEAPGAARRHLGVDQRMIEELLR